MAGTNFCCAQPQDRIDSPEPPARPLGTIDSIFAATALPEDHPHALKLPERKVATNNDIVQSPSITNKIKLQFRRTSLRSLLKDEEYEDDAAQMTLQEVVKDLKNSSNDGINQSDDTILSRPNGNRTAVEEPRAGKQKPLSHASSLQAFKYFSPLLSRSVKDAATKRARSIANYSL